MAVEIERKFLVRSAAWQAAGRASLDIVQGYLANTDRSSVRVRLADGRGSLSVKGMTPGLQRDEYEYPVPAQDARRMLDSLCLGALLDKRRHLVDHAGHCFEVDVFGGDNAGLVVAEVELQRPDEPLDLPSWIGDEVTHAARYYNFMLVTAPFKTWPEALRAAVRSGHHLEDANGEAP